MYQPPPGDSSTTVSVGFTPKKASVSTGCRHPSRATFATAVAAGDGGLQGGVRLASGGLGEQRRGKGGQQRGSEQRKVRRVVGCMERSSWCGGRVSAGSRAGWLSR